MRIDNTGIFLNFGEKLCVIAAMVTIFACIVLAYHFSYAGSQTDAAENNYSDSDLNYINSVSAEDFMHIKGIGEVRANAIVDYRDAIGGFTDYDQLLEIDGIADKLAAAIVDYIGSIEWKADGDVGSDSHDSAFEIDPHLNNPSSIKKCIFVCLR